MTGAVALMIIGTLILIGVLVFVVIQRAADRNKALGRAEVLDELNKETQDATQRADVVLNEHRDTADTTDRLRKGSF